MIGTAHGFCCVTWKKTPRAEPEGSGGQRKGNSLISWGEEEKQGFSVRASVLGWVRRSQGSQHFITPVLLELGVCCRTSVMVLCLLTEQHFRGEVSLGFPVPICLLGLGPWHRSLWQEEGAISLEHSFEPGCVWEGRAAHSESSGEPQASVHLLGSISSCVWNTFVLLRAGILSQGP